MNQSTTAAMKNSKNVDSKVDNASETNINNKKEETNEENKNEKSEQIKEKIPEKGENQPQKQDEEKDKAKETEKETNESSQPLKPENKGPVGYVFQFGEKMIYKVDSIESEKVTCVRVSGGFDFPKGLFLTEEILKTLKPKSASTGSPKSIEYKQGFEFEIDQIEYRIDVIDGNRATCIRTIEHDGSPMEFEMPVKQLEKLKLKPRERNSEVESKLLHKKSRVEEVKDSIEAGEFGAKISDKKRVSYVAEVQVKTKASVFEEKAKEVTSPPVKEEPISPTRPKPIGNLKSRVEGLNIDPTKLRQGAYNASVIKKKKIKQKQKHKHFHQIQLKILLLLYFHRQVSLISMRL